MIHNIEGSLLTYLDQIKKERKKIGFIKTARDGRCL